MLDEEGRLPNIKGALMADAVATTVGAVLGTTTTTTFVEVHQAYLKEEEPG